MSIYHFNSRNSNLHYTIDEDFQFRIFLDCLKRYVHDCFGKPINTRNIMYQMKHLINLDDSLVCIDGQTTKLICDRLDLTQKDIWCEEIDYIFSIDEYGIPSEMVELLRVVQFHSFIKKTRSGFVIYKSEPSLEE